MVTWFPGMTAKIHVMSHVVNYGSSVFEGIRCYQTPKGPAIFRLRDHTLRLLQSCKIYRIDLDFSLDELYQATVDLVAANKVSPCYIRPIVLRGYGQVGVNPFNSPTEVYIANYEWGKYLGAADCDDGVDVCVSSWTRLAPNTMPTMAKAGANYMNSQLIKMEAIVNGYSRRHRPRRQWLRQRGLGRKHFRGAQRPHLHSAVGQQCAARHYPQLGAAHRSRARHSADRADHSARDALHLPTKLFFSGTAAEITPIRSVDKITVGHGLVGPITKAVRKQFYGIVNGTAEDRFNWLTPVPVAVKQPVTV